MFKAIQKTFSLCNRSHIEQFRKMIGEANVLTSDLTKYTRDWQNLYGGEGSIVLFPKSTSEVSLLMRYCNDERLEVVPQGGNTSLVAGATPINKEIVLSCEKLNKDFHFDATTEVFTCHAGITLQKVQSLLDEHGFCTPYDLGARGSCMIGGNVATMAGGINFVKYGSLRGNILGLEVVLADGTVLDMTSNIRKDNTGTDLKQLFIGSEGTLGIITKINMLAKRKDSAHSTLFLKTRGYQNVLKVNEIAKKYFSKDLAAIEYLDKDSYYLVELAMKDKFRFPYNTSQEHKDTFFMLIEASSQNQDYLDSLIEGFYCKIDDIVEDILLAENETQRQNFWGIRESVVSSCKTFGKLFKYDISIDIKKYESFMRFTRSLYGEKALLISAYGHIGDGNIHLNIIADVDKFDPETTRKDLEPLLLEYLVRDGGSISAEHGVGLMKRKYLGLQKDQNILSLMKKMKHVFDPNNILNPGKIIE